MRNLVIALGLAAAAFAGSTVYFAHQLSLERERSASRPVPMATTTPVPPMVAAGRAAASAAKSPTSEGEAAAPKPAAMQGWAPLGASATSLSQEDVKRMQADYSRNFLAQISDPERREEMLAEHKMMLRQGYPRVDRVLGLTAEEYSRFIELSALQQLDNQEASARCMMDPVCSIGEMHAQGSKTHERELDQLLGPHRAQKLKDYQNTMGERETVTQLRNRLPDSLRLSDDKAEGLIAALAEERNLIYREAAQRGEGVHGFNVGAGMVFAPAEEGSFEQRYEAARQTSQRLRDRAAQYLDAEQMRSFNEMQDETLMSMRRLLRNKDDGVNFAPVAILGGG